MFEGQLVNFSFRFRAGRQFFFARLQALVGFLLFLKPLPFVEGDRFFCQRFLVAFDFTAQVNEIAVGGDPGLGARRL